MSERSQIFMDDTIFRSTPESVLEFSTGGDNRGHRYSKPVRFDSALREDYFNLDPDHSSSSVYGWRSPSVRGGYGREFSTRYGADESVRR